ncbi:adenosylmethionine decarboxylase [bacterium]|nr:adenosylmethionine decarboxylase [bacterium]
MLTLGKHYIIELSKCNAEVLNNLSKVKDVLSQAAIRANAEIKELAFHHFYPQGVSGVVVIAESHISVHTWPENGYAALDIYTCGEKADPKVAYEYIKEQFQAQFLHCTELDRGLPCADGSFTHKSVPT